MLFDVANGALLSSHVGTKEVPAHVLAAASAMRDLLRLQTDDHADAREVIVGSSGQLHLGLRSRAHMNLAVLFICGAEVSVGMALARARICLKDIEEAI